MDGIFYVIKKCTRTSPTTKIRKENSTYSQSHDYLTFFVDIPTDANDDYVIQYAHM